MLSIAESFPYLFGRNTLLSGSAHTDRINQGQEVVERLVFESSVRDSAMEGQYYLSPH
jgi:hypothetical protein